MWKKPSHLLWKIAAFAACALILAAWVYYDLPCPIRHLTGVPCPGCGMSRAWLCALRLDLSQAFRYHPLFWAVPAVALLLLYDFRLFADKRRNTVFAALLAIAAAIFYVIRLAAFFLGKYAV